MVVRKVSCLTCKKDGTADIFVPILERIFYLLKGGYFI
jgi:hypothetical protein